MSLNSRVVHEALKRVRPSRPVGKSSIQRFPVMSAADMGTRLVVLGKWFDRCECRTDVQGIRLFLRGTAWVPLPLLRQTLGWQHREWKGSATVGDVLEAAREILRSTDEWLSFNGRAWEEPEWWMRTRRMLAPEAALRAFEKKNSPRRALGHLRSATRAVLKGLDMREVRGKTRGR